MSLTNAVDKRKIRRILTPEEIEKYDPIGLCKRLQERYKGEDKLRPEDLTKRQRRIVIEYLYLREGLGRYEIANFLKMTRVGVTYVIKDVDSRIAASVKARGFSTWDIVARLSKHCDRVKAKALEQGNLAAYDRAEYRFLEELRKLGVVYEKPTETTINVNLNNNTGLAGELVSIVQEVEERKVIDLDAENDIYGVKKAQGGAE